MSNSPVKKFHVGMNEEQLTKFTANFLTIKKLNFTHVANERKTKVRKGKNGRMFSPEGNKLRQMGVRKGVSDMLIFKMAHGYGGLAIELKSEKLTDIVKGIPKYKRSNYPDEDQKQFLVDMWLEGYAIEVCWNGDEVMDTVNSYLDGSYEPCEYVQTHILKELYHERAS